LADFISLIGRPTPRDFHLAPCAERISALRLRARAKTRIDITDANLILFIEIFLILFKTVSMIPLYRVFGANRVSPRHPSLLIAYRVQKRQVNTVPLAPASKERLQKDSKMRRGSLRLAARLAVSFLTGLALSSIAAPTGSPIAYTTLNFGTSGTFLTGIRGNNIVGNYVITGTTETGWLLDDIPTEIWALFPEAAANGANFPGAIASSPYGPGFGSHFGILRAVGSYETQSSSPDDFGYLYDGAAEPNGNLTTLVYPSAVRAQTLSTIAHGTFGNQVESEAQSANAQKILKSHANYKTTPFLDLF
jgi:hypothetical protein